MTNFFRKNLSIISIWIVLIGIVFLNFSHHNWQRENGVIQWDIKSYYAYLPATFIYKDLSLDFREENFGKFGNLIWPVKTPTGKQAIITSMGMSVLYSPFFFIAHTICKFTQYEADGYTLPYKFALVFSALFYLALGLFFLRKILLRYFSDFTSAVTILSIVAGTNLLYYSSYEAAMPHVYNFSLITVFVYMVIKWHENTSAKRTIGLGLLGGLITLIRPTNILVLLILLLWDIKSFSEFKERIFFFLRKYKLVILMIISFVLVWVPQFLYWKYIAGKFLYFSYGDVGGKFFFNNPQIFNILISYKKGWLVYTPLMILAIAGIFISFKKFKTFAVPSLIFLLLNIYILSSWWCWWFGGSFGLRSFIDSYGIMAIPLAVTIDFFYKKKYLKFIGIPLVGILVLFNIFQTQQYTHQAIHYWWMNKDAYWETFLKLRPTDKYWDLITIPDYEKARKGIYVAIKPENKKRKPKIAASKKEISQLIKRDIYSDSLKMLSLKNIAQENKLVLDSVINKEILKSFSNDNLELYKKEIIISKLEKSIRENPDMMKSMIRKAKKKKISVDSMITLDANWLYKKNKY